MFIVYPIHIFKDNIVKLCLQFIINLNIVCDSSVPIVWHTSKQKTASPPQVLASKYAEMVAVQEIILCLRWLISCIFSEYTIFFSLPEEGSWRPSVGLVHLI